MFKGSRDAQIVLRDRYPNPPPGGGLSHPRSGTPMLPWWLHIDLGASLLGHRRLRGHCGCLECCFPWRYGHRRQTLVALRPQQVGYRGQGLARALKFWHLRRPLVAVRPWPVSCCGMTRALRTPTTGWRWGCTKPDNHALHGQRLENCLLSRLVFRIAQVATTRVRSPMHVPAVVVEVLFHLVLKQEDSSVDPPGSLC